MGGIFITQDRVFFAFSLLFSLLSSPSKGSGQLLPSSLFIFHLNPVQLNAFIFPLPSSLCSPSTVVLVSGVAVKRNRELLDGRWDKHDTKDAGNIADLISQWVSPHHPRLWSGRFGQGDRCDRQSLPFSKPETGAQDGRIGYGRLPERGNLEYGLPGHFQKGKSRSALCLIPLNFKTWIRDDGRPPRAGCRILITLRFRVRDQ